MAERDDLNPAIRGYIAAIAVLAAVAWVLSLLAQHDRPDGEQLFYGGVFGLAVLAAQWFPIHLTDKTKVFVDATALTALALTLPAPLAAAIAACAVAIHQIAIRPSLEQRVFNVAQTALYVLAGSLAFHAIAGDALPTFHARARDAVAVGTCVLLMHAINTASVAVVVALQLGRRPVDVWTESLAVDLPEHVALVAFGILLVAAAGSAPWLLALLPGPMVLVYCSLSRSAELRRATHATIAALVDLSDLLGREVPGHSRRVAMRTRRIAERLGLPDREVELAMRAAQLRGIDAVEMVPAGRPSAIETRGSRAARLAAVLTRNDVLARAVRHHEERWDGSGLPAGLAGDEIPTASRLVAVADAYERLSPTVASNGAAVGARPVELIAADAGRAWDPVVVGALIETLRAELPESA